MRTQIRGALLALAVAAALTACAATAPANSSGTGSASSSAPAASAKHLQGAFANYTRVVRNGQTFYCDQEKDTGTRMVHETCLTESQMQVEQENARNFMQGVQGMAVSPPSNPNSVH